MRDRLPWEIVETLPSTDAALLAAWQHRLEVATSAADRARALVGRALASYWAVHQGVVDEPWEVVTADRERDVDEALDLARSGDDVDLLAECLLGRLYALWGPDRMGERPAVVEELAGLRAAVADEELRLRIREWIVLGHLDRGDLAAAKAEIDRFATDAAGTELVLLRRREELWRGNVAMLEGDLDTAVRINQDAISSTATTAGSPFSFQNVAITLAIERYLRRGLADVVDPIRSIRASSPRVAVNWDTGLAFSLAEIGALDEAAELFEAIATDDFAAVRRDLNWLVVMHLLGLVALHLDDRPRIVQLLDHLRPFAALDATHGSGYASYGPVGRVVGALAARCGHHEEARRWFDLVLTTRAPGPWTSLTRLDLAVASRAHDPSGAGAHADQAARELQALGLVEWAGVARVLGDELRLAGHGEPIARFVDGAWTLRHPAGRATVPAGKGTGYLVQLLARPGEVFDVAELDTEVDRSLPVVAATTGTLDAAARQAYRRRLDQLGGLRRPLTEAESAEAAMLRRELAGAAHAPSASVELERARVRVTKAIHRAIDAVRAQSPGLGDHLGASVETGRRCVYAPADGTAWRVVHAG